MIEVTIQAADFDIAALQSELLAMAAQEQKGAQAGAAVCFTGLVRQDNEGRVVQHMELEHYPNMTERSIGQIVDEARQRWPILAARVVHRVGRLSPGEQVVFVGVSSHHRHDAFSACEFIMDYLKTRAPFWKKEHGPDGERWVEARDSDTAAANRWVRQAP